MHRPRSGNRTWLLAAGVALVAILVVATVANGGTARLWFLLILVCPLMMLFMMGPMGHGHASGLHEPHEDAPVDMPELAGLSGEEQVRALRRELTRMAWRQEALRQDLEHLEAEQKNKRVVDAEITAGSR